MIGLGCIVTFVSMKYFRNSAVLVANAICSIFAGFMSLLSLHGRPSIVTHWLLFWMLYICVSISETYFGFLLKFVPFYLYAKFLFLVSMMVPTTNKIIYEVLRPTIECIVPRNYSLSAQFEQLKLEVENKLARGEFDEEADLLLKKMKSVGNLLSEMELSGAGVEGRSDGLKRNHDEKGSK